MSGFEVVGVVLGSVPLLISAVEHYAEGVKTMKRIAKYKAQADVLVTNLIVVHSSFRNTCEKLLSRLQLPDEDIIVLLQGLNGAAWRNKSLDDSIRRTLKSDYESCRRLLIQIFATLDDFREKMGLPEDYAIREDYTPSWFRTNDKQGTRDRIMRKLTTAGKAVQLGFEDGEYSRMLYTVDCGIKALEKILQDGVELEPVRHERSKRRNARLWATIREFASSLFRSIRWDCACRFEHIANLRLQIRKRVDLENISYDSFDLLFSYSREIAAAQGVPWSWRQAKVEPSEISHQTTGVSFSIGPKAPVLPGTSILSLCNALQAAPPTLECIGFLENDRYRHHIFTSAQEEQRTIRSLRDVLIERNSARTTKRPRLCDYTTKERYQLSLTLAYTVLQFYGTPWLQDLWSKKDIYFIGSKDNLIDSLYMSQNPMPKQKGIQDRNSLEPRPWSNPTIYALGVVLLELTFGCPLDAIPPAKSDLGRNGYPDSLTECRKASRLASAIEEKDGKWLATAIIKCLRYNAFEPDDSRFQECFYNDVIAPLETCLEYMP